MQVEGSSFSIENGVVSRDTTGCCSLGLLWEQEKDVHDIDFALQVAEMTPRMLDASAVEGAVEGKGVHMYEAYRSQVQDKKERMVVEVVHALSSLGVSFDTASHAERLYFKVSDYLIHSTENHLILFAVCIAYTRHHLYFAGKGNSSIYFRDVGQCLGVSEAELSACFSKIYMYIEAAELELL